MTLNESSANQVGSKWGRHFGLSINKSPFSFAFAVSLIVQTMQGDLIVPAWGQFTNFIREIYEEVHLSY
jgi:hypothetical protein